MGRWVLEHSEQIKQTFASSLELGSGVGLTGFCMASVIQTTLSDYRQSILKNLRYNLWMNSDAPEDKGDQFESQLSQANFVQTALLLRQNVRISYLNWFSPND